MSALRTLLALWLLAMIMIAVFTSSTVRGDDSADDDDDDDVTGGAGDDAGAAGEKPLGYGLAALAVFPKNEDRKVAAGEKVETLVVINNIAGNPEYSAVFVAAHLSPLNDFNRYYQNFSGNAYKRVLPAGQQTTLKYSFTPDVNAEPMDFSLVVRVFIQPMMGEENSTFAIAAYNSTFTIGEPLGTDPKSVFTVILFGGIAAAIFYWYQGGAQKSSSSSSSATSATSARSAPIEQVEVRKGVTVEKGFVSPAHQKYLDSLSNRGRSGSPKK